MSTADVQVRVQALIDHRVASGDEVGVQVAGSTFGMVGMNGSGAYADIDSGIAVAVMRSRFDLDLTVVRELDRSAADLGGEE